jgi:hypothetical protein
MALNYACFFAWLLDLNQKPLTLETRPYHLEKEKQGELSERR